MSKIQRQDIKTEAELAGLGAPPSSLPGDDQIYVGANSINKTLRQAILDGDIGGGAGGINYILNGEALANTNGWATYADAAQSRPVDGTGGSPNVTWTRSTTNPLRKTAHFVFTKDAVNRQGQGTGYAFTIDRADQAKPLQIEFEWEVLSGVFAGSTNPAVDSDLIMYIYDITNNRLIEPSGRLLEPAVIGQKYRYRATFQTSPDSLSYRLIGHVATTSSQAYSLAFDAIRVGPQVVSNGAVVTDWQSYTPTGSHTINTNYAGRWRRVGDSVELQVRVAYSGANSQGALQFTQSQILPTGLSVDSNKVNLGVDIRLPVGGWAGVDSGVNGGWEGEVVMDAGFNFTLSYVTTAGQSVVSPSQPFAISAGDNFNLSIKAPIAGWSSNVQVSSDTETRKVNASYVRSTSQTINAATDTTIVYDIKREDSHSSMNTSNGRYSCPVSGSYKISASIFFTSYLTSAGHVFQMRFIKRNSSGTVLETLYKDNFTANSSVSQEVSLRAHSSFECNAGDTLEVILWQNTGAARTTIAGINFVDIERISGPSQIAASEPVNASAVSTAGQVLAHNTDTILNVNIKDYDSHNSLTLGASARFTAPVNGVYEAQSMIRFANAQSFTASNLIAVLLYKNGSIYRQMANILIQVTNASTGFVSVTGSSEVQLNAGEYIEIRAFQNSGANRTLEANGATNWISIKKVN